MGEPLLQPFIYGDYDPIDTNIISFEIAPISGVGTEREPNEYQESVPTNGLCFAHIPQIVKRPLGLSFHICQYHAKYEHRVMINYDASNRCCRKNLIYPIPTDHFVRNEEETYYESVYPTPMLILYHSLSDEVNHESGSQLERKSPDWYSPPVVSIPNIKNRVVSKI